VPEAPKPLEASTEELEKSPETSPLTQEASQPEKEAETSKDNEKVEENQSNVVEDVKTPSEEEKPTVESEIKEEAVKTPDETGDKSNLPSFPGTMKSVPGSNDVKIEIDSNSLLDRVILYSLKNTVVDNSRLDAAKNKYMLNKGNTTGSFSSNSNGSDSNSSSKSVEKLIEEFKGGCSKPSGEGSPTEAAAVEQKSDISNESSSHGAETFINSSEREAEKVNDQNVITSSRGAECKSIESMPLKDVHGEADESPKLPESSSPKNLENEALDFRDTSKEASPTMLDLSIPHRDEKSVPMIKRDHALYVGLPDFSKQIFTEPSISRPTNTVTNQVVKPGSTSGPPKIKNPDFSAMPRVQPELQMRKPDFSKSFESPQSTIVPVTPSNFPEIIRKNNYISDLQLKPPTNQSANPSNSSSYKIDYRSSTAISQKLMQDSKPEQPSTSQTVYPNMKKEGINAYNQQQLIIDEPMAHIIHKNQFLPHATEAPRVGWNDRGERLLGGSSMSVQRPRNHSESEVKPQIPEQYHSSEDLRKNHPAHYAHPYKEREFNNNSKEAHQITPHEFSLKQKEQQLRQEGTIITVKNEPMKTPTREINERRSADLFRDYKLKQPKESPDSARRAAEHHPPMGYQQAYPDFPASYPKPKVETVVKTSQSSVPPLAYPQMKQMPTSSRSYHSPSPVQYQHHQPKSPLTVPPGPSLMNPPSNWPPPPPLVMQQSVSRHAASPGGHSQSPNGYPHHASPSQSPHMNYGYPYQHQPPPGPTAVKVNHNYPPYKAADPYGGRHDVKEIPNRNYQPPSSSSSGSGSYYHQKYPDFGRHFDQDKPGQIPYDPNVRHPQNYPPSDMRQDVNYPRMPHNELEIRSVREQPQYRMEPGPAPSFYPKPHEKEAAMHPNYPPRGQEPMRHPEAPLRIHDGSRAPAPMKMERRIEEPPKIQAGPSNLNLRRPEPTEVSVIAKVKIEPAQPPRNAPLTSTIIKSAKSIFAEVKRESPLDLSVKTVKTKADSTGCDQDMMRHRAEPSGLKVEFTPNFEKIAKTDCRQQARTGPQDYPQGSRSSQSVPERPSGSQRYPNEQATRTPPTQSHQSHHQVSGKDELSAGAETD
jgi:hypothetical protein